MSEAVQKLLESGLGWVVTVILGIVVFYQYRENRSLQKQFLDFVQQTHASALAQKDKIIESYQLQGEVAEILADKIKVAKK